jgi:hypothetical protein
MGQTMTITIFVGDVREYLADVAKKHDPLATSINSLNCQNLKSGTYYASIADLDNFGQVLQQANTIVYSPPAKWSDERNAASMMQYWSERYLSVFCCDATKTVVNFNILFPTNKTKMLSIADTRKSKESQIWIAGCSISHGVGVADHERYGELISKELNLPVTFLTAGGSSIRWASDQILRSDILPGDTIFWGITSPNRLSYWDELTSTIRYSVPSNFDTHTFLKSLVNKKYIASDHMIYESIVSIHNVINFCKTNNITLVLATLLEGMEIYLKEFVNNFVPLAGIFGRNEHNTFLDLGTDNKHPGPKSHQFIKEQMLKIYYEIKQSQDE